MSVEVEINEAGCEVADPLRVIVYRGVTETLKHHEIEHASISLTLLGDKEITELNREYLEHDYVTDVISFPLYDDEEEMPVGDIYIGYEQAKRQAAESNVSLEEELARLAIHGTLHVLGHDHPDDESRIASEMWLLQEQILKSLS